MSQDMDADLADDLALDQPTAADAVDDIDSLDVEGYDEGDTYTDDLGDEDLAVGDAMSGDDAAYADVDEGDTDTFADEMDVESGSDAMAVWEAFEDEVADGLDAADTDEFLARI